MDQDKKKTSTAEQQLLPTIEPSEDDMIQMAIKMPFEKKVDKAIGLLQLYKPTNHRNSGGKDSVATKWLCDKAGIEYKSTYSNTTIDPPELVEFIKKHHPNTEWIESGHGHLVLERMVEKMNMPTRRGAWCCDEYKDCCRGHTCEFSTKCLGVRALESAKRSKMWKPFLTTGRGDVVVAPVVYWTEDDIWRLIKENNIPYCELYDQGWTRIGCVGCPKNEKARKREFALKPEFESIWKEGAFRCWERGQTVLNRKGKRYFVSKFSSPDMLWDWWMTGVNENAETNCIFEEMMEGVQ